MRYSADLMIFDEYDEDNIYRFTLSDNQFEAICKILNLNFEEDLEK